MALLSLTVVMFGGVLAEPGAAGVVLRAGGPAGERASQLTRDDAVASLLSCLQDAAKELGKRFDGVTPAAVAFQGAEPPRASRVGLAPRPSVEPAVALPVHVSRVDLPPPRPVV